MPQINQLSSVNEVQAGDQIPVYSQNNGDARKASLSLLKQFFQQGITAADDKITQYAAPSATGFSVQVNDDSDSVWFILTPTAGFANGELILPALDKAADRQEILVNCTQSVAALAIDGNGATVTGAPTTLVANEFFRLRFDAVLSTWYRVG